MIWLLSFPVPICHSLHHQTPILSSHQPIRPGCDSAHMQPMNIRFMHVLNMSFVFEIILLYICLHAVAIIEFYLSNLVAF